MPASAAQICANQINAQKSTGPVTNIGKSKVANNAVKHGLFSTNLILADEDPLEYQNLLEQLQIELSPSGVLEHALTERIAVSLWRQKRLIRAETAYIELDRKQINIVVAVNQELHLSYSEQSLSEADLTEFDAGHYQWCRAVLQEYETIVTQNSLDIAQLKKSAPLTYQQLFSDAGMNQQSPEEYLQEFDPPSKFFIELAHYCREQIKQAEQRPMVLEVVEMVKNKGAILKDKLRDTLSKYQIMLDSELYKAIKALREAQDWRFKSLTVIPNDNGFVLENAP
jgi:hypothetical protein